MERHLPAEIKGLVNDKAAANGRYCSTAEVISTAQRALEAQDHALDVGAQASKTGIQHWLASGPGAIHHDAR